MMHCGCCFVTLLVVVAGLCINAEFVKEDLPGPRERNLAATADETTGGRPVIPKRKRRLIVSNVESKKQISPPHASVEQITDAHEKLPDSDGLRGIDSHQHHQSEETMPAAASERETDAVTGALLGKADEAYLLYRGSVLDNVPPANNVDADGASLIGKPGVNDDLESRSQRQDKVDEILVQDTENYQQIDPELHAARLKVLESLKAQNGMVMQDGRLPTFVEAGDGSFRVVGGPDLDGGTVSIVLMFCFVALIFIAVIFVQQRSSVMGSPMKLNVPKEGCSSRKAGTRRGQSTSQAESKNSQVNMGDTDGYFATRKRVQNEETCVADVPSSQNYDLGDLGDASEGVEVSDSGSDYGKLNDDVGLADLSEESVSATDEEMLFDYRTVDDEVDDLENESEDSAAQEDHLQHAKAAAANWSSGSESEESGDERKSKWTFW